MKDLTSSEIRQMFLDYFKVKGHQVEPSVSLVPNNDPTLLWINSGVATLKKYFDGSIKPDNPKIVNAQKAIRTNDIENVGFTARHHTFFEMLGNFSIGDYFKKEAIEYAWEFLTSSEWIGFDADKLSVTVHPEDDEAYNIWLNDIKLPAHRIIRLEENFWDIGEGPSGPNTEIFYDRGEGYGNDPTDPELYPGGENERYLEVWNLVFSQFNHNADHTYTPLPQKNIDTGMGLERLVSIIQNVKTNFDTDLFIPIIKKTEVLAKSPYGSSEEADTAYKVIADHIRTVAFAIGDHAMPGNEGRGYILRRLLRRAVRFAKNIGIEEPFMYKLVPTVGEIMASYYPEVSEQADFIMRIVKVEEERFHETLNDGLDRLYELIEKAKASGNKVISGEAVFKLYDTYGFPKELTEEYLAEHELLIDHKAFEAEMEKQRTRAREAREEGESMHVQSELMSNLTESSTFVGYNQSSTESEIVYLISEDNLVDTTEGLTSLSVILKSTPFYAESGGQIADKGMLISKTGKAKVVDVQKSPQSQNIHYIEMVEGYFKAGASVKATIDQEARRNITKNHTATHLLHQALRDTLGDHVHQAGSIVRPDKLRFDFSHFEQVTQDDLVSIEKIVNEKIWQGISVKIEEMAKSEAEKLGAMALFGEKYGDVVRVVQISDYSVELCGGCHVENSAEIGLFKITSESGIGAGVRRIEAVTSQAAFELLEEKQHTLQKAAALLKIKESDILTKIATLNENLKILQKEKESFIHKLAKQESQALLEQVQEVNGVKLLATQVSIQDIEQLRNMMDEFKQKLESAVILFATEKKGKVILLAGITKDLVERKLHAGKLISQAAKVCGGGGGGRPDLAQAGGKDPAKINQALKVARDYIKENLD